ncbi:MULTISPECIES: MipA/OmpV family protein [Pantoea]|jgi:outer membrane scaffolding protein for murein synthesis (MipA/OmpV family)|uniref:MipA/OmpV family protein n=1 Tax=Pantoea TaxID=53335 RepID=UPI000D9C5015|nr:MULTISPECIES: MipA/OmpV family protein [Pantoea]MBD9645971.1 MipA/OmpV family protein [Pantoea sp. PNT02]MDR6353321.1 outer membrane protein [Pantoea sp. SORGH_AS_0659]PYG49230.1 outer membrane scaffolding protein for murein synthesis (MipA/OmpV family) [Pantoea sp. AG1095]WGK59354.1 MipA/OmpV family protein [Pantoea sp. SS70]
MITRKKALYSGCLLLVSISTSSRADDSAAQDGVMIGVGAQTTPTYSGADKQRWQAVPMLQARKGAFFVDSQKGVGYDLQSDSGLYLEHSLGYGLGRADKDSDWRDGSDKLRGMGTINATLNTAIAAGWAVSPWLVLEAKAVLPLTDSQGVNYRTSVTLIPLQSQQDSLSLQTSALFGDARYMQTWYGVSARQSVKSGYATYSPAAGFYGVETDLTWSHQFTQHWGGALSAGYTWLDDHAADSPIVFRQNQLTATAAVTYTF